jgi:hypothetical protein
MSDEATRTAITTRSNRRTVVLLVAWVAAAVAAGIPGGAASTANAERRAAQAPVVVNTGPECFAGHTAPPAPSKSRD